MRIISHRGNLTGRDPEFENTVVFLTEALQKGFDIEFDVWYEDGYLWLGHDQPTYPFSQHALDYWAEAFPDRFLYVHCKNIEAAQRIKVSYYNVFPFMHDVDDAVILKDGKVWVHPVASDEALNVKENTIFVLPDADSVDITYQGCYAICTDYPENLRNS